MPTGPTKATLSAERAGIVKKFGEASPRYWGLEAPGVQLRTAAHDAVALTFDCCGGHGGNRVDWDLLDFLERNDVAATFFLNYRWVHANRTAARRLIANPLFDVANHGSAHLPLSVSGRSAYGIAGTRDAGSCFDEVSINQEYLAGLMPKPPRYCRSGTAFFDDVAVEITRTMGLLPVGFSVNGDGGATFPAPTVAAQVSGAVAGDIVIAHANHPRGGTADGIKSAVPVLRRRGLKFLRLSDVAPAPASVPAPAAS
ncbi:polysaccharide deacetylase family protein [Arthrobacter sp. NPDC056493]|uniref:polysaccharide deacetylase family protein n=1 Tax=Arthrobacter sp. NPDC056493 TaxID=3345839 RepID=UPI00366E3360